MKLKSLLAAGAAAVALSVSVAAPVLAQTITSSVSGVVTDAGGAPVSGAEVTVTDMRTGTSRTSRTGSDGRFSVPNLEVGGPYEVMVDTSDYADQRVEGVFIDLSSRTNLAINLGSAAPTDAIVVTAARDVQSDLAIGPSSLFSEEKLGDLPSIGRDIRDIIRLDPRVKIDGTNGDSVSCIGGNNRFNSFTVDGVRNADAFGLNASGFVNRNGLPIPYDAIRETSVEFAPFDVEYGQFTGCNINVVTKSGTNEFSGSAFAVYSNQKLTGSTLQGAEVGRTPFADYNWGATFGGPIIPDRLFFFGAYEEYKDNRTQGTGPLGGGFATERPFATLANTNAIVSALDARGYPTSGGILSTLPQQSRRITGRIDWNITDNHRLAASYQRLREFVTLADDFNFNNNLIGIGSNFYKQGTSSETYSVRLFSQWSDNLSTEFRASRADILDLQDPLGGGEAQDGNPLPRVIIGVTNDANGNAVIDAAEQGAVIAGPGFSRSANLLETQIDQIKFKADYTTGIHTITAGYELDQLDVYNVFAQNATGTLVFQNRTAFNLGQLTQGTNTTPTGGNIFANTPGTTAGAVGASTNASFTGDINDAAAIFSRAIHSVYLQDEMQLSDRFTATLGLRYDRFDSSDNPRLNNRFVTRYGFDNTQGYGGLSAIMPRLGMTYEADETLFGTTTFRAGAGVFTGGDPTVWFSNAFSNPGTTLAGPNQAIRTGLATFAGTCTAADLTVATTGIPQIPACLRNAAIGTAVAADGRVDAIDPDFKVPTVIRANLGFSHETDFGGFAGGFFDEWNWQVDAIYTAGRNNVDFVDVSLSRTGTAIDGRPIYAVVDRTLAGCTATPLGVRNGFANVNAACFPTSTAIQGSQDSIVLTNALQGSRQLTLSGIFSKGWEFDSPLFGNPSTFDLTLGYAFTDAEDTSPATSSVSTSNFQNAAISDLNDFGLDTSVYETRHNATANLVYGTEFFKDLKTSFSFFFQARSGQPYSLSFNNISGTGAGGSGSAVVGPFGDTSNTRRSLLYIPTGPTDPRVTFAPTFDQAAFFSYLSAIGADAYAGQIAPRNAFRSDWFLDLDFRFQQELPGIWKLKPKMFVDIENLPNLVTDQANIFRQVGFPYAAAAVTASGNLASGTGAYTYTTFVPANTAQLLNNNESVWAVQFGLRFDF